MEKLSGESAACPGCLRRDRVHGQPGRLLLRGPLAGAVLSRDLARGAHTASQKTFHQGFQPSF